MVSSWTFVLLRTVPLHLAMTTVKKNRMMLSAWILAWSTAKHDPRRDCCRQAPYPGVKAKVVKVIRIGIYTRAHIGIDTCAEAAQPTHLVGFTGTGTDL
eukprot:4264585-Pyramimonas_sp.AAC.1